MQRVQLDCPRTPSGVRPPARSSWPVWLPGPRHALRHAVLTACRPRWTAAKALKKVECAAVSSATLSPGAEPFPDGVAAAPTYPRLAPVLDLAPTLSAVDVTMALALGAAAAAALWLARRVLGMSSSSPAAKLVACFFGLAVAWAWRAYVLERAHSAAMLTPQQAADDDSLFKHVCGLDVHYKLSQSSKPGPLMAFLHGFGSNEGSWSLHRLLDRLTDQLGGLALAPDMPGFGLTQRSSRVRDYSLKNAAAATSELLHAVAEERTVAPDAPRLLVGHSLGALVAVRAAALAGGARVAGLVLVAPAILAGKTSADGPARQHNTVLVVALTIAKALVLLPLAVLAPVVGFFVLPFLRSAVRNVNFWRSGLRGAFVAKHLVTTRLVDTYRRPACVRDWDIGMLRFVASRISPGGVLDVLRDAAGALRGRVHDDCLADALLPRDDNVLVLA
jgi:pimeloyl-ACP methyl ester carboxylesterase